MAKEKIKKYNYPIIFMVNVASGIAHQDDWQEVLSCFCCFWPLSEAAMSLHEGVDFGAVLSQEYFVFQLHNHPDISDKMRIFLGERQFDIKRIFRPSSLASRNIKIVAQELK